MNGIIWINLVWTVALIFLLKKDLKPFLTLRNALLMVLVGILTIVFWASDLQVEFYKALLSLLLKPIDSYESFPFLNAILTVGVVVIREELSKGVVVLVFLVLLKLLNPKYSLRWPSIVVVLFVANLFSSWECSAYKESYSFIWRILMPLHFVFEMPMVYLLDKHFRKKNSISLFVFLKGLLAAMGVHYIWNLGVLLDNDLYVFMATNASYTLLHRMLIVAMVLNCAFYIIGILLMALELLQARKKGSVFAATVQRVSVWSQPLIDKPLWLFPVVPVLSLGLLIAYGTVKYRSQEFKPILINYCTTLNKGVVKTLAGTKKVDFDTLTVRKEMDEGKYTPYTPLNNRLRVYTEHDDYCIYIYVSNFRKYVAYKGLVIAVIKYKMVH